MNNSTPQQAKRQKYLIAASVILALLFASIAVALFLHNPKNEDETSPSVSAGTGSDAEDLQPRADSSANANRANPPTTNKQTNDADILRASLNNWIAATNNRDIEQQMSFYTLTTARYYTKQYASQAFVRAEKMRSLGSATSVEINIEDPQITLAPTGRTATMRFIKNYSIQRGGNTSRGKVLQELEWLKTENGWRIISERDLRVLS